MAIWTSVDPVSSALLPKRSVSSRLRSAVNVMTRKKVAATHMQLVVNALLLAVYTAVPFAVLAAGNRSEVKPDEIVVPYLLVLLPLLVIVVIVAVFKGTAATSRVGPPLAVAILFTFDYRELRGMYSTLAAQSDQGMVVFWGLVLVLV